MLSELYLSQLEKETIGKNTKFLLNVSDEYNILLNLLQLLLKNAEVFDLLGETF